MSQPNYRNQSNGGFSLVIALSLMAFVLLLVLTILSLVKVETGALDSHLEIQKAREGARLALNLAIGELQKHAGHDERVTARADITGTTETEAAYWTGVWDASSTSTIPFAWLVSGTNPDPTNALNDNNSLELVGAGSVDNTDDYVRAPFVNIFDANGNVSSRIAWWISDEGVKASVAQLPFDEDKRSGNPSFIPDASMDALQTMLVTSHGLEEIFANYDRFDPDHAPEIDRVTSIEQLIDQAGFQKNADGTGWDFEYTDEDGDSVLEQAFHTLTPMSYGLLASTEDDVGLMEDLSRFPERLDLGSEFIHYVNRGFNAAAAKSAQDRGSVAAMRQSVAIRGLKPILDAVGTLNNGDIASLATPILTNFMIAFAVYESGSLSNPHVRMHFFSEFWNPYTSTLAMSDSTDDYKLELEITGLPSVRVRIVGGGQGNEIDLQDVLGSGGPVVIRLEYDQNEAWHPGMTKNWTGISGATGPSPYVSDQTLTKDWFSAAYTVGGSNGIPTSVANAHTDAANDKFRIFSAGPDDINVAVYLVRVNRDTLSETKSLLTQTQIRYSNVDVPRDPNDVIAIGTSTPTFGYQFILKGPHHGNIDTTYGRGLWLSANDPRNPSEIRLYAPTYDGLVAQALTTPLPNPNEIELVDADPENQIERPQRLFNRSDSTSGDHYKLCQESPLFELPRERILSLASLQHLYFHNERPFKVGNSWGDDVGTDTLEWFDQYFFSGISQSDTLSSFTQHNGFPNPILTPYNYQGDPTVFDDDPRSVARNALVNGRFNLNSTSVSAWKAVLGGLRINDWPYLDYYPGSDASDTRTYPDPVPLFDEIQTSDQIRGRGAMFARFSSTLHETYDVFQTPEDFDTIAPSEFYRRGVRYLTQQQVEDMAVSIVSQIKTRGSPFFLVKDFLNNPNSSTGSILEEAIQSSVLTDSSSGKQQWDHSLETDGVIDDDSDRIDIDHFSPGFLTQADIMTAIGPILAPRSDTFRIRARCQTFSPFNRGEAISDATIEAVVQRVPDPFDSNDDINLSIQRKFEILSVRWLTVDEI